MSVHADDADWVKKSKAIFQRTGGEEISATNEVKGDFANAARPMHR